jgi:hypothetical protein
MDSEYAGAPPQLSQEDAEELNSLRNRLLYGGALRAERTPAIPLPEPLRRRYEELRKKAGL